MEQSWETVVGLEVHVQLNTATKQFCGDANIFGEDPNLHTSSISLAHPGTLPNINQTSIQSAIKLALAIGAEINYENRFDRKHYFYADLPKGYQITQDNLPICVGGSLELDSGKKIRFHHVHMEEDAGKSIHHLDDKASFIDLNRAGVPLLELVTEPDFRSGDEVLEFISKLQQIVRYLNISDGNMEQGSLRCDCNVSVMPVGSDTYGERCEIKNMNSKKFAKQAVEYESKRQIRAIANGEKITMQTLHFDPSNGTTTPTRDKETAHDYRYLPDPDLPPILITEDLVSELKTKMPLMPEALKAQLMVEHKLSSEQAYIIASSLDSSTYFFEILKSHKKPKPLANFFINTLIPYAKANEIEISAINVAPNNWSEYLSLIETEKVNRKDASDKLFPEMLSKPSVKPLQLAEGLDIIQSNNPNINDQIISEVLAAFPEEVKKYKGGKKALVGFFIGEAMKKAQGKANPKTLKSDLIKALSS